MTPAEAIAELARRALDGTDPVRKRLTDGIAASSGLHPTSVERLTTLWAIAWQSPGPERLRAHMADGQAVGRVAVVAPGNLCAATWSAIAEPLVAGNWVRLRPGSGDPLAARCWRSALAMVAPALVERVEIDAFERGDRERWRQFLHEVDALVVYGGDAAVAAVWRIAGEQGFAGRLRGHGDRRALAVVTRPEDLLAHAAEFARDALLADGRGCMSLRTIWLLGEFPLDRWRALHDGLRDAIDTAALALPAGTLAAHLQADARAQADGHHFAEALGQGWLHRGRDAWLATRPTPDAAVWGCPGRGLVLAGAPDADTLARWLTPWHDRLSAVAGKPPQALVDALAIPRVCAPGRLQAPPAEAGLDGHPPLAGLYRSCYQEKS